MISHRVITLLVSPPALGAFPRRHEPVRLGVPVAEGVVTDAGHLSLIDAAGHPVPLQCRVLDRWRDGSVRWVLLDFLATHGGSGDAGYVLNVGRRNETLQATPPAAVEVSDDGDVISVSTGRLRLAIARSGAAIFRRLEADGTSAIDAATTGVWLATAEGPLPIAIEGARVEENGPVRAIVAVDAVASAGGVRLNVKWRVHAFAGSADVRIDLTIHNPAAAVHRDNFWELGDPGSVLLADGALHVAWPELSGGAPSYQCSVAPDAAAAPCGASFELWQASSGGPNWNSRNHVDRHGNVALPFNGYRLAAGGSTREGSRAAPVVHGQRGRRALAVAVPDFWQNFPRTLEGDASGVTFRFFPRQQAAGHELQGGEQKTHTCYVAFAPGDSAQPTLEWARQPLFARATVASYVESGTFPYVLPLDEEPSRQYAALVANAIGSDDGFEAKRERIDEYGWRNYGDIYADHERVYFKGEGTVHSHYNNQYDALAGLARQFVRSGDPRWWQLCRELAAHVIDIDIYRTDGDKSAYNHGLFWHTAHYADAGRSTHRSYPRAPGVAGGGPSSEHNYATGLMLYYFLTGEPAARDAAVMLARWVVDMDDGSQTVFRWLSRADTGIASSTFEPSFQGPGRGAGHSIAALLDGYRLTRDGLYLEKAEALIRRCIHPQDDIAGWRLLDIERRWSYTIFLHVLGRYLDEKAVYGQLDRMYAYARRALLVYAGWMQANETPYLDRPGELEYPTETWVAQELWKSEVFTYAAKYADNEESRAGFLERADFFFDYAVSTLGTMPTRTLARPLVLLLSRGLMHGYMVRRPEALTAPAGPADHGIPLRRPYVPQKVRAMRRAMAIVAGGAAAVLIAAAAWLVY